MDNEKPAILGSLGVLAVLAVDPQSACHTSKRFGTMAFRTLNS
jgi:hypothetical protein